MTKPGDKIKVLFMKGEPEYTGREGIITNIDSLGQMHGTWGGCAVIPEVDRFEVLEECNTQAE